MPSLVRSLNDVTLTRSVVGKYYIRPWDPGAPRVVPEAYTAPDWTAVDQGTAGDVLVTLINRPFANPAATGVEYQVDGGSWESAPLIGNTFVIGRLPLVAVTIRIRDVNEVGVGPDSDAKIVTVT